MDRNSLAGGVRVIALAALAVAIWALARYGYARPQVLAADAPAAAFSSGRAEQTLARILGPERPHPVSSDENAAVRDRIRKKFASLGVATHTYTAFTCNSWRSFSYIACATVTDIVADVVPGQGKAIVMMAHYDSVPAGPGASDDESGVATVLETARALKAAHAQSLHPVVALITDGEEAGLLGANAFLQNARLKDTVGVVVNVEARGTSGPSLLFQTSPGDGNLIGLYAAHMRFPETSSLYAEIYKYLPNDTDLTLFIRNGFPSFNFAFADNVRYYHSPRDTRSNLDPATLQMHGDNLLSVVSALENTPYAALKGGNDVYLSVLGLWLPRIPQSWALPLAIVVFLALLLATWLARDEGARGSVWRAVFMPPVLIVISVIVGFLIAFIAQLVSGHPDPSYAYPLPMRLALALGVLEGTLIVSRKLGVRAAAASAWLWMAGLGIVTAIFLPGLSPYFVFPSVVAAVLLLATARLRGSWSGGWGQVATLVSSLAAMIVWIALVASGETLMGLRLHPLFTIPAALAMMTVVPLIAVRPPIGEFTASSSLVGLAALALAVLAGLHPAYSTASPQRLDLVYFENGTGARWVADTAWKGQGTEPIPAKLRKAGPFHLDKDAYPGLSAGSAWVAPAGAPKIALPSGTATVANSGSNRVVTLHLQGSADTSTMMLLIPKDAGVVSIDLRGQHMVAPKGWSGSTRLLCVSRDCRDETVTLTLSGNVPSLNFDEGRYGFPRFGAALKAARPATAMPSQSGDQIILENMVMLPR